MYMEDPGVDGSGFCGIMEKKMETTNNGLYREYGVYYWGYII